MSEFYQKIPDESKPYRFIGRTLAGTGIVAALFSAMSADGTGGLWTVAALALTGLALITAGTALIIAAREIAWLEKENAALVEHLTDQCDACCVSGPDYGPMKEETWKFYLTN